MPTRVSWDALAMCGAGVTLDSGCSPGWIFGLLLEGIEADPADPMLRKALSSALLVHRRTAGRR